jgi:acyl-CoA thioesterase I
MLYPHSMKRLLPVLLLLLLNPILHAQKKPIPTIVCFGDSITAGYGVEPGHTYPDALQTILDAHGYHYRVLNMGISGDTTKDGVSRLSTVLAAHPAIAIVEFGGNDGLRGLPITATRANFDTIISTLQNTGVKVALAGITLPPDYGQDYINAINQTYALAAKKFNVPLLPFIYVHVYTIPNAIQPDGIHPTAKGAALVAENIYTLIKPLLRK